MRYSGVPSFLLQKTLNFDIMGAQFPFMRATMLDNQNNTITLTPEKQKEFFKQAHKINTPMRVLVFSTSDILWAQLAILQVYTKTAEKLIDKNPSAFLKWSSVQDSFEDDEFITNIKEGHYPAPYMVIDNVKCSQATARNAKISYLLKNYPNAIFLIMHGKNPYNYWLEEYGSRPSFVLRIDRPMGRTTRI